MKRFIWLLELVAMILVGVYLFNGTFTEVVTEVVIFYSVMGVVAVVLACYIGWQLTRAMNPRQPKV